MLNKLILAASSIALVASPAAARDHRWDNYHGGRYYGHRGNGDVLAGALIGAVAGAAIVGSSARSNYGYGYGYPAYGYAYPAYGYGYPAYGYAYPAYGYPGYAYPAYGYRAPAYGVSINVGRGYRGGYRHYRGW